MLNRIRNTFHVLLHGTLPDQFSRAVLEGKLENRNQTIRFLQRERIEALKALGEIARMSPEFDSRAHDTPGHAVELVRQMLARDPAIELDELRQQNQKLRQERAELLVEAGRTGI